MSDELETCPKCGISYGIAEWPFCPHGRGVAATFQDGIPGGLTVENYSKNPITFYSHSDRRAYMKAHGLQEKEKFCPLPGTDIDPAGIPNPKGFMDPQTLANAKELICRNGQATAEDSVEGVIRGEFSGAMTERDAVAVGTGDVRRSSRLGRRIARG